MMFKVVFFFFNLNLFYATGVLSAGSTYVPLRACSLWRLKKKKVLDSLGLELQMVMSRHAGAGK